MSSFNRVIIMGNLTSDPELRYTPKGTAIAQLTLAVNRKWKSESGEKKEEVSFVDCNAWGRTAETIGQYMKKGRPLLVEGRLKQETWTDKQTQKQRSALKVVIESFSFVDTNPDAQPKNEGAETPPRTQQPAYEPPSPEGDDVPF